MSTFSTAAVGLHDGQELVERGGDGALLDVGIEDDHQFVVTHAENPPPLDLGGHGLSVAGGLLRRARQRLPSTGRKVIRWSTLREIVIHTPCCAARTGCGCQPGVLGSVA